MTELATLGVIAEPPFDKLRVTDKVRVTKENRFRLRVMVSLSNHD